MKLTVHLVTWNGVKYIPYLFESLRKQSFKDWELHILDNASTDGTFEDIQKELINFPVQYQIQQERNNIGFSGGHNKLFLQTNSEYFLLLNQDMYLEANCLSKLVDFLNTHERAAGVSPRLMKWDFAAVKNGLERSFTNYVDALGLKVFRNRRVIDQYAGYEWNVIKNNFKSNALSVMGLSGALPAYRRNAIEAIAFADKTMFDVSYSSYKEDVDLSFRLLSCGFESFILLDTIVYHDRTAYSSKSLGDRTASLHKAKQPPWVRYHSYKNQLMTLYKNEYWQNLILDFPWIMWYELKKFGWFLVFDWKVLQGVKEVWNTRRDLAEKRQFIQRKKRVTYKQIRKWWVKS